MDSAALISALQRRLNDSSIDKEVLQGYLDDATNEIKIYLGITDDLPELLASKVAELAAIMYQRDTTTAASGGIAKIATTEEKLSQTVEYTGTSSWQSRIDQILNSLARYRVVTPRYVTTDSTDSD